MVTGRHSNGRTWKNMEDRVVLEYMLALENASFYVELGAKSNTKIQSKMLETMRSLKRDLEILKVGNPELMNAKSDQKEIN